MGEGLYKRFKCLKNFNDTCIHWNPAILVVFFSDELFPDGYQVSDIDPLGSLVYFRQTANHVTTAMMNSYRQNRENSMI